MEAYTSLPSFGLSSYGLSNLEKLYGKPITLADREMVEEKADDILSQAQLSHADFLVVGDPFEMGATTTHTDLVVRAKKMGIEVKVVHNASVMNAIGICSYIVMVCSYIVMGELFQYLSLRRRGDLIASIYEKIQQSLYLGLHTLCLLD
ncbi:tetrapyrrole (corrin/porphyrin) methylase [Medicago truncatula]|uniref:Tetrapyrrole (Corrin/porphyrin) methylase n=1 Tax=Medicago truncatula TaxID=3880 RepID=G7J5B3_MEDTR|nr:tetrapyrrole (corrin/porphyrin) methylase [Medicago truncatula]